MPSSHSRVAASPSFSRIAVTNAWNEAFVGGKPILPFHSGSTKSKMDAGSSLSESTSVL
jgi:hypothetical protein